MGHKYLVTKIRNRFCCRSEHNVVVFNHKDRLIATCRFSKLDGPLIGIPVCFNGFGQIQLDRGAAADFAVDADLAARFLGKAVNLRQTETGSLSDLLCREERLEDMGQYGSADADAVIAHGDHGIGTGNNIRVQFGIGFIKIHVCCLDDDAASAWESISRVYNQIENRRLELRTIDVADVECRIELQLQFGGCTSGMTHQRLEFQQYAIEIERYRTHHLTAREHQ